MFRCARKASILVRSSVIWIDLIIVFGPFGGLSGSSVKVGGPLCGGTEGACSVEGESETGLSWLGNSTLLLRASCSGGRGTLGSPGLVIALDGPVATARGTVTARSRKLAEWPSDETPVRLP